MTLQLLDLFSGIGGFSYAAERLVGGYETVAFVEREPFCQSVLRKHWPTVPIHDDICKFQPERHSADVVCGGFPCQDISLAGKQAGIKQGTRSGLFYELMRVVRMVGPQYVVLENVAAILANGLDTVLGELAEAGFDAEWACIPASAVGACHQRDRWWLVAYATGTRTWQHKPHARRQRDGASVFGDGDTDKEISAAPNASSTRSQAPKQAWIPSDAAQAATRLEPVTRGAVDDAPNANHSGPQGQRIEHELSESSGERAIAWGHRDAVLNPEWGGYISKPVLCRGDDGLCGRVDRLKALGNAVVPQVAAIPLARVIEIERAQRTDNPATHPRSVQP
jgi:DNA (cytosine-5)-methyltransferase 1